MAKMTLPELCQPGGPLAWTWPSPPQAWPSSAGMRKPPSLHDAARAGWGLSCPTSWISLASGLPGGQGGAGGDGVAWPLACHISPSPPSGIGLGHLPRKLLSSWSPGRIHGNPRAEKTTFHIIAIIFFRIRTGASIYLGLTVCLQGSKHLPNISSLTPLTNA